jgi:DNA-directed RNA polymerase subunit beta
MNAIPRSFTGRKRIRKSFGRIPEVAPMPNLIDVQRASYEAFLQMHTRPDSRTNSGLQEVFKGVFPIDDFAGRGRLEFVYYELEEPKYDVEECIQRGMTFAAPLKVILRLIVWDVDEDTGARSIRDIKEQPVYMGDMPLMTDNGTGDPRSRLLARFRVRQQGPRLRPHRPQAEAAGHHAALRAGEPRHRGAARGAGGEGRDA